MTKVQLFFRVLLGLPKSLYVNMKVLPFRKAIRIPILLSLKTKIDIRGGVKIQSEPRFGMIRIGIVDGSEGIITVRRCYFGCDSKSKIIFGGRCSMAPGATLKAIMGGVLFIGNNVTFNYHSTLLCKKSISIGNNVMTGWNILISDGDGHSIIKEKEIINPPRDIVIGNHVWIGSNSTLLKGCCLGNDSIVGMGSVVTKAFPNNVIVAGVSAKIVKDNIIWRS